MATPSGIETITTTGTSPLKNMAAADNYNAELALLDLYCGCGGMSTGLCHGAKLSSVNLVTVCNMYLFHFFSTFYSASLASSCSVTYLSLSFSFRDGPLIVISLHAKA